MSFRKYCRGMSQHELTDYSIYPKANLRESLQMAYLWQLSRKNQSSYEQLVNARDFFIINVIDVDCRKGFRWGWGCMSPPKSFFFLKMEGVSGFQTPSEDSRELCLSQTGLAKNEKLHQTISS